VPRDFYGAAQLFSLSAASFWLFVLAGRALLFSCQKSKQKDQKKQSFPAHPPLTPLFFRACAHGISQLADALIDFLILLENFV
jgi:hypothetical protein